MKSTISWKRVARFETEKQQSGGLLLTGKGPGLTIRWRSHRQRICRQLLLALCMIPNEKEEHFPVFLLFLNSDHIKLYIISSARAAKQMTPRMLRTMTMAITISCAFAQLRKVSSLWVSPHQMQSMIK